MGKAGVCLDRSLIFTVYFVTEVFVVQGMPGVCILGTDWDGVQEKKRRACVVNETVICTK